MKASLLLPGGPRLRAVDEHSKFTLDGLVKANGKTLFEAENDFAHQS